MTATTTTPIPRRNRRVLLLAGAALCALAPLFAEPAAAQQRGGSSSHRLNVSAGGGYGAQRIDLSIGRSLIVDLPRDAKEVFVANPKVANAVVRSANKLFIIGVADGNTSMFAMDADGNQIVALEIVVGRDLNVLRQTLRAAMPKAQLTIQPAGDSILLTGTVDNAADAQQAMDIANAFVGVTATAAGATKGGVINSLTIRGKDQVMLKVTISEVSRQALKQLGVNASGNWSVGSFSLGGIVDNPFSVATQTLSSTAVSAGTADGSFTLRALERAGLARTLAEPTLTAISGESAKFTAGGEVPVPSSVTPNQSGGPPTIGVEFKPYGIALNFTPVVLSDGRISMRVATEVTDIDNDNKLLFPVGSIQFNIPSFRVRKADTTVEVPSGGSLVTAGLIQQSTKQAVNGLPGLMNLPILGALFRSRDYQRNETELMIMVTPYIARPSAAGRLARPDDGYVEAHDAQGVLLGRLNKIYGGGGAPSPVGLRGRVGFITD